MSTLYEPARMVLHNGSTVSRGEFLNIQTPPEQWAYALTIAPHREGDIQGGYLATKFRVRVLAGEVGIGILNKDESKFVREVLIAESDDWSEFQLVTGVDDECGSLVVRNVSPTNTRSIAHLMIGESIPVGNDAPLSGLLPVDVFIDRDIFAKFRPWSGNVPGGYFTDWTGIMTRAELWAFSAEHAALLNKDRFEKQELPFSNEHVLDWVPLIQALLRADSIFRMAALGAGWGRWVAAGAALASQLGLKFHGIAVEAEPQHFAWMQRHMRENKIGPEQVTLINAAASGRPGVCWFRINDDPSAWYGQSIAAHADQPSEGEPGRKDQIRIKTLIIDELLAKADRLDYLHMDIQGTEFDFLSRNPNLLDQHVAMVNIGTHSKLIESRLRSMFIRLGWAPIYDIPLGSVGSVHFDDQVLPKVEFGDGVQVWKNPRF